MIEVNYNNSSLWLENKEYLIYSEFKLHLNQVIIDKDYVFALCIADEQEDNYQSLLLLNNVFAFKSSGELLWRSGVFELEYPQGRMIKIPASFMKIEGNIVKLFFQSNHEISLDKLTGKILKKEFVLKN